MCAIGHPETAPDTLPEASRTRPSPVTPDSPATAAQPVPKPPKRDQPESANRDVPTVRWAFAPPSGTSGLSSHPSPSSQTPDGQKCPGTTDSRACEPGNPEASQLSDTGKSPFSPQNLIPSSKPGFLIVAGGIFNCRCTVEVAHIQARADGGLIAPENVRALCPTCHHIVDLLSPERKKELLAES